MKSDGWESDDLTAAQSIRTYRALFAELLDRELILPATFDSAMTWIPDFERRTTRMAAVCGALLGLGDALRLIADAGNEPGVALARAALEACLETTERPTVPSGSQ